MTEEKRILLVENSGIFRKMLQDVIAEELNEELNIGVEIATNYPEAVELIENGKFDIVIADIHLGVNQLSGLDLLKSTRTPVIIMSLDRNYNSAAINRGAAGFFCKSDGVDVLINMIIQIFSQTDKKTILVVDDEHIERDQLKLILGFEGYNVLTARSTEMAKEIIKKNKIDLVLADTCMGSNGPTLVLWIKENYGSQVVILSMSATILKREINLEAGANGFYWKADGPEKLIKMIANLLREVERNGRDDSSSIASINKTTQKNSA